MTTPVNIAELKSQVADAVGKGDWASVKRLASQITTAENAEREARDKEIQGAVDELTQKVKTAFDRVCEKFQGAVIDLVGADRAEIVYTWSPEKGISTRIKQPAAKAKASGGGGKATPTKGGPKSEELLPLYGGLQYKDTGKTIQEAWDESSDGNKRYQVRLALLKEHAKA